jgi:hypothetical protein
MQKKEGGIIDKWSIILPSRTQSATINGGSQPTKGLVGNLGCKVDQAMRCRKLEVSHLRVRRMATYRS